MCPHISSKRVQPQKSGQRRPCPFSIFIGTKMPFESWYGRGMGMWTCKYIHLPMLIRIYFATQLIHILHVHTQKHMYTQNTWTYMGHFPQDGENEQNLSDFFCFWSFTVTKRFDFLKFSQLFWRDYVRWSLKILSFTLQKNFGVPCSTPVFALLSDFWVKIRALVRPNRQRWTGFDLLIIFLVKFWWFSFFLEPL